VVPRIQYVTTSDGVRIAYAVNGRGPAILSMPPLPFRHVELEWTLAGDRRWLTRLASHHTVIQYDPRGLGLSERRVTSYTSDGLERDIDAVIARAAPDGVALFAAVTSGSLAIAYAARHPERVSHLVLWCASARSTDVVGPQLEALLALVERDWELFTETMGHVVRGWSAGDDARQFAAVLRACATPEAVHGLLAAARAGDVRPLLSEVRVPTLIAHRRDLTWITVERAVELASQIPDARLVILDGDSMAPWAGDMEAVARTIEEFLGTRAMQREADVPTSDQHVFRCDGEYWTLSFAGRICRVRDAKGLHHLAYLLRRPGESTTAAELLYALEPPPAPPPPHPDESLRTSAELGDAGEVLDARAKSAYRRRIAALRTELAEAEEYNEAGRAAAARCEIEQLSEQLAAAVGIGGRDRRASSAAERARLTVTKRIRDAIARVQRVHPELGQYLNETIRTGLLCAYVPDSEHRVRWLF
jgi:pimeloyl-ACP methyl ester carboxylesterase